MGQEIDLVHQEIDRLKLTEQRVQQGLKDFEEKIDYIRAKTETKLFASLPDAATQLPASGHSAPAMSINVPPSPSVIRAQEMLSPKMGGAQTDQ